MPLRMPIIIVFWLIFMTAVSPAGAQGRSVQPLVPYQGPSLEAAMDQAELALQGAGVSISGFDFSAAGALFDTTHALNEAMEDFTPNYSPNGMPGIPLSCSYIVQGTASTDEVVSADVEVCTKCYKDATDQIDSVRVDFERLRAVGLGTKKYVDAALAFGDSFSTVAGNGSLGWPKTRPEVIQSYDKFKIKYAASFKRLLARLDTGLRAFDTCEDTQFNNPDWYKRHGFIFYAFMEGHYTLD